MSVLLVVVAAFFAVVAGANDGSSILAAGLRVPGLRPWASVATLLCAVVVGPLLLFGTGVATTLAHRLVPFDAVGGDAAVLVVAVLCAMVVVFALSRAGLPTSLTLALVGGITGAAVGAGLPVRTTILATVLIAGVLAPVLAAGLAVVLSRFGLRGVRGFQATRRARRLHTVTFTLQCIAYSANGGQKMLAVFALATGAASAGAVTDSWWLGLALAALFGLGILLSLRRVSTNLGRGVVTAHLRHALVAETCSFAVAFAAGLIGVPLTMSQTVTGALVGSAASESRTRVRWPAAARVAGAWVVTLPASVGLGVLGGAVTQWL